MKEVRIVLVGTEYQINLGSVCRVIKNFGFDTLYLVNPKCNPKGFQAKMYSKHAYEILKNAKIVNTLEEATKDCSFKIGTSGILKRHRNTFRNPISTRELYENKTKLKGRIAIIFGGEGIGLTETEINDCDFLITIPTNPKYPIMNLSHSVSIVLYELSQIKKVTQEPPSLSEKDKLLDTFNSLVDHYDKIMRKPTKTKVAFKRIIGKSLISQKEAIAVMSLLQMIKKDIEKKKK